MPCQAMSRWYFGGETYLIDHVAFRMPTLVPHVPVDLHKLFEDCAVAACALGRISCGVVEMAVNVPFVLIVRVLRAEERGAHRAREVLDVELFVCLTCSPLWAVRKDGKCSLHAVI